jgi:hypothetical protein
MVRELAGRDVNAVADAGTGCLDAGEVDGFQRAISLRWAKKRKILEEEMKNHQPRLRVVAYVLLNRSIRTFRPGFPRVDCDS